MATITVKNIPDDLYALLKQSAEAHRRNINSEVIVCIEKAVRSQKVDPEATIAQARILREKTSRYQVSDEILTEAKRQGRL